jgi:hypothetical protein
LGRAVSGAGKRVLGGAEAAGAVLSGVVAEPISGLAGLAQSVNPFAHPGAGAKAVEATRSALTLAPQTEAGIESVQAVGKTLEPAGKALAAAEDFLGDATLEATGSPALAAAAKTTPTAIMEALGLGAGRRAAKTSTKLNKTPELVKLEKVKPKLTEKTLIEAAPDVEALQDTARAIYQELDDSGIRLQKKSFAGLVNRLETTAKKANVDNTLTPKTARTLELLRKDFKEPQLKTVGDIEIMRRKISEAAKTLDSQDSSAALRLIDEIDEHLDNLSPTAFAGGRKIAGKDITTRYKAARNLWGRSKRAELISDAMERAGRQASGFENGIRIQLRQILNNKKRSRFFSREELAAMDDVVKGTNEQNLFKLVGRLGFSEGQATNIIGGLGGTAFGTAVGGAPGAVTVNFLGQLSRKAAQKATVKNAKLSDAIVRARGNGKEITEAYLRLTPKNKRKLSELSEILTDPRIDVDDLLTSSNELIKRAAESAKGRRAFLTSQSAGVLAPTAIQEEQ